jgi:RHS repeat-associated protein
VRAITDGSGAVTNSYAYDSYGTAEESVESLAQRFRYTGREFDALTGLYHYRARAYDPETARFLQEDPLHFEALDLNIYKYVRNNPINYIDPSGKMYAAGYANAAWAGAVAGAAQGAVTGVIADCLYGGTADIVNKAGVERITGFDAENCVAKTAQRTAEGAIGGAVIGFSFVPFIKTFYKSAAVAALFGRKGRESVTQGLLNQGDKLRLGYSWNQGEKGLFFSLRGDWVRKFNKRRNPDSDNEHLDIFNIR